MSWMEATLFPEINVLLAELLAHVQAILREDFVGMYLYGSLATGDFDAASDIDFLVVTQTEMSDERVGMLKAMHADIAAGDSKWAKDIEGAYISRGAVKRYEGARHLQLERGAGQTLKLQNHFRVVERFVLRDCGIVLAGPPIRQLIEPVSADELKQSMLEMLNEWIVPLLNEPILYGRGDQAYIVLSLCRVLYTFENGKIVSKHAAARWAQAKFCERWRGLIERALEGRFVPKGKIDPQDAAETIKLAEYTLENCGFGG